MRIKFDKNINELAFKDFERTPWNVYILCSMGVDSVAATHFLIKNKRKFFKNVDMCIIPIHFNHRLRKQNNDMEDSFYQFNRDFNFSGYTIGLECKTGTEDECRQARIDYINQSMYMNICITAHHLDDCVESYLLNVFRGKEGFLPIPFVTTIRRQTALFNSCSIMHPFLFTEKKDFVDYAQKYDLIKYVVEDETNKVVKGSRRNLIRNEIIPILDREKMGLKKIVKKKMQERLLLEMLK